MAALRPCEPTHGCKNRRTKNQGQQFQQPKPLITAACEIKLTCFLILGFLWVTLLGGLLHLEAFPAGFTHEKTLF